MIEDNKKINQARCAQRGAGKAAPTTTFVVVRLHFAYKNIQRNYFCTNCHSSFPVINIIIYGKMLYNIYGDQVDTRHNTRAVHRFKEFEVLSGFCFLSPFLPRCWAHSTSPPPPSPNTRKLK